VGARVVLRVLAAAGLLAAAAFPAFTETMDGALRRAYVANPTLNAQRAQVRVTDETVPIAKSGQRPRITGTADIGFSEIGSHSDNGPGNHTSLKPGGVGVVLNQNVFDGLRTRNSTRAAESQVFGARETLRNTEQNVLLNGATDYMNVLRDSAILSLQRNNVEVLQEQLRQTKDRFAVGEVTRTDVAQAEAALAGGQSQVSLAESNLKTSIAAYRRDIGDEPKQLAPGRSIEKFLPRTLDLAVATSQAEHPAINASMHGVDSAELQVKVAEGALYPSVGASASLTKRYDTLIPGDIRNTASLTAQLSVPIYEGGEFYARTRQAKETAGQARINVDVTRDQVRAAVVSAWGALEAAKAQIIATQAQVNANEIALNGVREEAKVGQRTTLDVLNAQQALLNSRVLLITAQRDRVVASYSLLSAVGKLSARVLGLKVDEYDAKVHFEQVKDKWIGLRTPDGR
jgi:outer membrane protein